MYFRSSYIEMKHAILNGSISQLRAMPLICILLNSVVESVECEVAVLLLVDEVVLFLAGRYKWHHLGKEVPYHTYLTGCQGMQ